MSKLKPDVMIAMPSGESIYTAFVVNLKQIEAATQSAQVHLGFAIGSVIHSQRNGLANSCLGENADMDYIFFLDTDIMCPVETIDRLLSHKKDIVCATYRQRKAPFGVLGKQTDQGDTAELRKMDRVPAGCLMIKTDVFRKLTMPYFEFRWPDGGVEVSEDYIFSEKAHAAGYDIWCDIPLSLELGHLALQPIVTKRDYSNGQA